MIRTRDADADTVERGKKSKMVTTRDINVILDNRPKKLTIVTTKNINPKYIDKDGPPEAPKDPMITTHNIEQFQKKTEKSMEKKPWKEMTDEEKKVEMKRRAVLAKATRERKKEEEKQVIKEK